jgi:predicted nucleic acid-binding protein
MGSQRMICVFDTNILIDYLNGMEQAAIDMDAHPDRAISRITWIEVLAGVYSGAEETATRSFLSTFQLIEISSAVAHRTIEVRRDHRLKLPDAIIYATTLDVQGELVTRNTRDFRRGMPNVRVPYIL